MSKFYGEVEGNRGVGSRVGTIESGLRSSAQSSDGSIVIKLHYEDDELMVEVGTMAWSASDFKRPNWWGTFEEFDTMLRKDTCEKHAGKEV